MTLGPLDEWLLESLQKLNPVEGSRIEANLQNASIPRASCLHLAFLACEPPKLLHAFQSLPLSQESQQNTQDRRTAPWSYCRCLLWVTFA